jgi:cholesterol transport system auxiliary component
MRAFLRIGTAIALAGALGGCSIGSMLGGGAKPPAVLFTLNSTAAPAAPVRSAAVGETVTIRTPVIPRELRTNRVPVEVGLTQVQYVQNLQWVDTPDRLFQDLVEETVRRTTSRVVLDPNQSALDPGLVVSGELNRFGYDSQKGVVVVQYDASLATQGGTHVETRRFEASVAADGTAGTVGPALNDAANQVAAQVAQWIGG